MSQLNKTPRRRTTLAISGLALMLTGRSASAGGLAAATGAASAFSVWSLGIAAVLSVIYLLYEGMKCWTGRGDWINDFGSSCVKVAVTGAVVVLAPYLWSMFTL